MARKADGSVIDLAMSPSGRLLSEEEVNEAHQARERMERQEFGTFDRESRQVVNDLALDDQVTAILRPMLFAPKKPVPPPNDRRLSVGEELGLSDAWSSYDDQLALSRRDASDALAASLVADAPVLGSGLAILAVEPEGVSVRCDRQTLEELARRTDVAAVRLEQSLLPRPSAGATSANTAIGMDIVRSGPGIYWDGNANGSSVGVGFIENWFPVLPPGNAAWSFGSSSPFCSVNTDCGACGWIPNDLTDGCRCVAGRCRGNHSTMVMSVLASVDNGAQVGARGSRIYFESTGTSFSNAINWMSGNDVHILSLSVWGGAISAFARDDAVRNDRMAIFNLATNGAPTSTTCASPNVICVGNWNEPAGAMAGSSSWVNFTGVDREQPDLVAPGTNLRLYDASGTWVTGTGTSFSTPMAASAAALLYDISVTSGGFGNNYYPSWKQYPEATKALFMAASQTDVDGMGDLPLPGAPDQRDGAGGFNAADMERIYNAGQWTIQWRTPSDPQSVRLRSVHLNAGERLRAFMAWSRCPSNNISALNADLDLRVKDPGGNWVAFGDSFDQTYEGLGYTAPSSGTYELWMTRWRMNSCNGVSGEIVGAAYDIQ